MKNDVVRWDHNTTNYEFDSDYEKQDGNAFEKFYNQNACPITTRSEKPNNKIFLENFRARNRCHSSSIKVKCDNIENRIEAKNKKIAFLVNQRKNSHKKTCICLSEVIKFASLSTSELNLDLCSCTYSNLSSNPLQTTSLYRTVRGLNLSKFIYFCLQVCFFNLLCSITVGASTSVNNEFGVKTVNIYQDYHLTRPSVEDNSESDNHYTHTWAVHIPNGDSGVANEVARSHGFVNLGKIFDDHYHFAHHKVSKRSVLPASTHHNLLTEDVRVHWAKQQKAKSRRKRDFIRMRPSRTSSRAMSLVDSVPLSDPKWSQMWYLNRGGGLDMNVIPAWKEGITGKGVVVTILDDGLESDHPDIEHNYDAKASYDVNSHDDDPMPHYDMTDSNRHGTRCAGEVAATANNSICAVGIAYGASVGGVRMLDGDVTDAVEARSLSLNPQHIDIYSASWGPDDDGKTVDGPGELASRAFIEGVTKGRNGKGSIFIWASGNGGRELDNCNCDGYTNSIWTLSISSATEDGNVPWYSEKCSSTLATTYSSGGQNEKQVVTTDLHHSCTVSHTGTSASAPLAAGIAALVLESNQNLTWRDLQHIVVRTAKPANLRDQTWSKNGVGRRISHSFGYGLMDAAAMVKVARTWKTVPEQQRCEINAPHVDKVIPPRGSITLQLTVKHCSSVNYLEHVQAKITLTSQRRGDIQLYLKSPAGTKVTLLTSRIHDVSRSGFNQWPFMSVHTWGESPHGNWQLEIHNEGHYMGQITQWDLIFYGTESSAQPDDPVQIRPGKFFEFGKEMDNNKLDVDHDAQNGQWRNVEQVGEYSHMSSERTNTACLKATIDQKCLVCAFPSFIYEGRCYQECPPHTYILPKKYLVGNIQDIREVSISDVDQQLQSIEGNISLFETNNFKTDNKLACAACDKSCLRCFGPLSSHCTTCNAGSQLHKDLNSNATYCYMFSERSSGSSQELSNSETQNRVQSNIVMFLIIMVPAVVIVSCLVATILTKNITLPWSQRDRKNYVYDRISLLHASEDCEVLAKQKEAEDDEDEESSGEIVLDQRTLLKTVISDAETETRHPSSS